jgi:hypothetical protein
MNSLKGFLTISSLIRNEVSVVAPLGELSPISRTYTKELGIYTNDNHPGFTINAFKSASPSGATVASASLILQCILVTKACIAYTQSNLAPYDKNAVIAMLLNTFPTQISTIELGTFVTDGTLWLPEWISWTNISTTSTLVKLWYSNASFETWYDEYSITPITPLARLDDFFLSRQLVIQKLSERTLIQMIDLSQEARQDIPETILRTMTFEYKPAGQVPITTNWFFLIYGIAGDDFDTIRDFLVQYILQNSTHTVSEWEAIFPDIFKRNEFVLLPRWDKYAIPNLTTQGGIYSSLIDPVEYTTFAKDKVDFYNDLFIQNNMTIIPFDYKALCIIIINGLNNTTGNTVFRTLFPDYIPIPSTSLDFNRMTQKTREWLILIEQLIISSEQLTPLGNLPTQFRRVIRDNKVYVSCVFDNISYIMLAKFEVTSV